MCYSQGTGGLKVAASKISQLAGYHWGSQPAYHLFLPFYSPGLSSKWNWTSGMLSVYERNNQQVILAGDLGSVLLCAHSLLACLPFFLMKISSEYTLKSSDKRHSINATN